MTKNKIGFSYAEAEKEQMTTPDAIQAPKAEEPAQTEPMPTTLVSVYFPDIDKQYSYLNDRFALEEGDTVFVSGKLYGKRGIVHGITRCFRVRPADYKWVIGKADLTVHGTFISMRDKFVSFDTDLLADKYRSCMIAPPDPEAEPGETELLSGEGWRVLLSDFENDPFAESGKINRALDYCREGQVLYLSVQNGKGIAFVEGTSLYCVEFSFDGETVSDLYCDCPFPDPCLCKHELAVLITLRMLMNQPELDGHANFTALDDAHFIHDFLPYCQKITAAE